jgi:hypothetical protein
VAKETVRFRRKKQRKKRGGGNGEGEMKCV